MIDLCGLAAGLFVILAFYTTDPRWLRRFAIASNLLFIGYGLPMNLWPIVLLHATLLPLNVLRLVQLARPSPIQHDPALSQEQREIFLRSLRATGRCARGRRPDLRERLTPASSCILHPRFPK
jgi:hypothetical protein